MGCDPSKQSPECFGSFAFGGTEVDGVEGGSFAGAIVDSSFSGLDMGPMMELWLGGEGGQLGGAFTVSHTGKGGGFAFAGTGVSGGPFAGLQLGTFYDPIGGGFGFYAEGHFKSSAGGIGLGLSNCG